LPFDVAVQLLIHSLQIFDHLALQLLDALQLHKIHTVGLPDQRALLLYGLNVCQTAYKGQLVLLKVGHGAAKLSFVRFDLAEPALRHFLQRLTFEVPYLFTRELGRLGYLASLSRLLLLLLFLGLLGPLTCVDLLLLLC